MNMSQHNTTKWVLMILGSFLLLLTILFLSARLFAQKHNAPEAFSPPKRLLVVFAHTDDEVTNAGLIRHWANQGTDIKILTLTDGAANPNSDLSVCQSGESITRCRMRELGVSAELLGIRHVRTPLLPDSKLMEHLEQASQIVSDEFSTFSPDAVLTMEPSGLNNLADHRAAFLSVARAAAQSNIRAQAYLSRLPPPFVWVLPSQIPSAHANRLKVIRMDEKLVAVKVADALAHRSQASTIRGISLGLGPERLFEWINFETYSLHAAQELADLIPQKID